MCGSMGSGMNSAEARVARAANFFARYAVAGEKFPEQSGGRAMHRVDDKAKLRLA